MRYTLLVGLLALGCAPSPSAPRSDKPVVEFYPVPGRTDLPFSIAQIEQDPPRWQEMTRRAWGESSFMRVAIKRCEAP